VRSRQSPYAKTAERTIAEVQPITGGEVDDVVQALIGHREDKVIVSGAARQPVDPQPAEERIGPVVSIDGVVAGVAVERGTGRPAIEGRTGGHVAGRVRIGRFTKAATVAVKTAIPKTPAAMLFIGFPSGAPERLL